MPLPDQPFKPVEGVLNQFQKSMFGEEYLGNMKRRAEQNEKIASAKALMWTCLSLFVFVASVCAACWAVFLTIRYA